MDEPAFKSVFEVGLFNNSFSMRCSNPYLLFLLRFQITLVRREDYHSLSNMPLAESRPIGDGWVEDKYQPTLNTSTYLLAFVVSQFDSLNGTDSKGRNVSHAKV